VSQDDWPTEAVLQACAADLHVRALPLLCASCDRASIIDWSDGGPLRCPWCGHRQTYERSRRLLQARGIRMP
jgi:DNA-directed RNA polymerase subunit RPC12/RpoP